MVSAVANPVVSVLWPVALPSAAKTMVLTAPSRGRPVLEVVEVGEHQLLAGVGHVEGVVPQPTRPGQQLPDLLRVQPEVVEVEGPVDVVEAVVTRLAHVHRGGQRRADAGADEADEGGSHPRS